MLELLYTRDYDVCFGTEIIEVRKQMSQQDLERLRVIYPAMVVEKPKPKTKKNAK